MVAPDSNEPEITPAAAIKDCDLLIAHDYDVIITCSDIEHITALHKTIPTIEIALLKPKGNETFCNFHNYSAVLSALGGLLPHVPVERKTSVSFKAVSSAPSTLAAATCNSMNPLGLQACPFYAKASYCPRMPLCKLDHSLSTDLSKRSSKKQPLLDCLSSHAESAKRPHIDHPPSNDQLPPGVRGAPVLAYSHRWETSTEHITQNLGVLQQQNLAAVGQGTTSQDENTLQSQRLVKEVGLGTSSQGLEVGLGTASQGLGTTPHGLGTGEQAPDAVLQLVDDLVPPEVSTAASDCEVAALLAQQLSLDSSDEDFDIESQKVLLERFTRAANQPPATSGEEGAEERQVDTSGTSGEVRKRPCYYFMTGYCRDGASCPNYHGTDFADMSDSDLMPQSGELSLPDALSVYLANSVGRQDLNCGDKIILSPFILMACEQKEMEYPMVSFWAGGGGGRRGVLHM
eukprot:Em0128g3a